MKKGFTLIELLVVVLIIGILAAIAFPQYEKAVIKSRAAKMLPLAKAVLNAEQIYYVANGEYTADLSKLDIDLPAPLSTTPIKTAYDISSDYWTNAYVYDDFQIGSRFNGDTLVGIDFVMIDPSFKSLYGGKGFRVGMSSMWGLKPGSIYCWEHHLNKTWGSFCKNMMNLGEPVVREWHGSSWEM